MNFFGKKVNLSDLRSNENLPEHQPSQNLEEHRLSQTQNTGENQNTTEHRSQAHRLSQNTVEQHHRPSNASEHHHQHHLRNLQPRLSLADLNDFDEPEEIDLPADRVASYKIPLKPLRIAQNYAALGGCIELYHGKIVFTKKYSKVTKAVKKFVSGNGGGPLKSYPPEIPQESFIVALAEKFREKVFRLLDEKTKTAVRLVCKTFRREIDLFAGLEVIVNDEKKGNVEFLESVEINEACILHLKDAYFKNHKKLFRCNWNIETIDAWTQLTYVTFRHLVLDCSQTLQCLYFRECALMKKYISISKADEFSTYHFPSLNTIIVYYGYFDTPVQNFKIFNSNMRYILTTFHCPQLNNLQVLPEPSVIDELLHGKKSIIHESCRWESHPLKSFISKHRRHLQKLKLVLYRSYLSPEKEHYHPPTTLVEYVILFPMLEAANVKNFRSYWRIILQAQVEAQVISCQAELWGDFEGMIRALRKNIFLFSASTLTTIYLESYHRKLPKEEEVIHVLDLKQFSNFTNLTELHIIVVEIGKRSDIFQVKHLDSLPRNMEVLIIENCECVSLELLHITTLRKLKKITVKKCGTEGIYGVTFEVARAFLIHKNIQVVNFGGFNEKNDTRLLYALIKKFNMGKFENEFEVVNPRDMISFIDWFPCCCCMKPHGEENINIH